VLLVFFVLSGVIDGVPPWMARTRLQMTRLERENCEEFCPWQFSRIHGFGKPESLNLHFLVFFVFSGVIDGVPPWMARKRLQITSLGRESCEEFCLWQFSRIHGFGKPESLNLHFLVFFVFFRGHWWGPPLDGQKKAPNDQFWKRKLWGIWLFSCICTGDSYHLALLLMLNLAI